MIMVNYGIYQNNKPSLTEVLGELLPVYNLELYEEMGIKAMNEENELEATNWFTKGLSMARELHNTEKIDLFRGLILSCL